MRLPSFPIGIVAFVVLAPSAVAGTFDGKIIAVTDGDTVTVLHDRQPEKIRLAGIDCPEKKQAYGSQAKQYTSCLCFGKVVHVDTIGKDRYGRSIGEITTAEGTDVNQELLRRGLAWHFRKYDHQAYLQQLEDQAHAARVGLWSAPSPLAPWEFRKLSSRR